MEVDEIKKKKEQYSRTGTKLKTRESGSLKVGPSAQWVNFGRCRVQHDRGRCPAFGKKCAKCNHFAKVCKTCQQIDCVKDNSSDVDIDKYIISALTVNNLDTNWYECVQIKNCNKIIKFKLDTGARINVIPEKIYKKLKLDKKLDLINAVVTI